MFKNLKIIKIFTSFLDLISLISASVVGFVRFLIIEKKFKNLNIRTKLVSTFLLVGILSITITGLLCFLNTKSTLKKVYNEKLTLIRETKRKQIETYFKQVRDQCITLSEDHMIIEAMNQFKTAFYDVKKDNEFADSQISQYALSIRDYYNDVYLAGLNLNVKDKREIEQYWPEDDETIILQYHYIANNLNPTGSKDNLEMSADGSQYSQIHSKFHPVIRDYQKIFGYYDIFLVDAQTGCIVYSVFKEVDFATNLLTGPYKDTNLARAFKDARDATNKEFVKLVDFELYEPSYEDPASFVASPIFDGDREIGVLVFQIPINEINRVMTGNYNWKSEGLGESGETYIVGSDYKLRNDSRFIIEEPEGYFELLEEIGTDKEVINQMKSHSTSILFQEIRTDAIEDALHGNTNTNIIDDYRGISVLSSYAPLNINDVNWVILSEIDKEEAFASLYIVRDRIFLVAVAISVLVAIIAFSISEDIAWPILLLVKGTKDIAKGDFSKRIVITQKGEIGKLADSFNNMTNSLIEANVNKEQALTESKKAREYSENLIETAQDAIIGLNENGIVYIWNKTSEDIFRYTKSEILGKPINTILPGETIDRFLLASKLVRFNNIIEFSGKTKNGIAIPIEMSISFQNNGNKGHSFFLVIRDITEKKKSEDEIKHLASFPQLNTDPILEVNLSGEITFHNNAVFQVLKKLGLKESLTLFLPEDINEILKDTKKKKMVQTYRNIELGGLTFEERISYIPEFSVLRIYALDITKRKDMEYQLMHAQKLESIGQLAAGIAHEINTPTQYILDNTSFLKEAFRDINKLLEKYSRLLEMCKSGSVTPELTAEIDVAAGEVDVDYLVEEIPNAIQQSLEGLDRVKNIVYAMKKFSHPDNENKKPIDINEAIKNTVAVARNEWKYVADVKMDFDSSLTSVPCFPGDFNQVILNLIVNAAYAIGEVQENGSEVVGSRNNNDQYPLRWRLG